MTHPYRDTKLLCGGPQLLHLLLCIGALGGLQLLLLRYSVQALSEVPQRPLHSLALLFVQALHSPVELLSRPSIASGFLSFNCDTNSEMHIRMFLRMEDIGALTDQFRILLRKDIDLLFERRDLLAHILSCLLHRSFNFVLSTQ